MSTEPAPTPETRVEWSWTPKDWSHFVAPTEEVVNSIRRKSRCVLASIDGGPARTPGEWLDEIQDGATDWRCAGTPAERVAGRERMDAGLAVLRDLLGDG